MGLKAAKTQRRIGHSLALVGAIVVLVAVAAPAYAAFPGANGRIAANDYRFIYSMNPDGTGLIRLTTFYPAGSDQEPAWSADGTKIAFSRSTTGPPYDHQIWSMNADGSNQTMLTSGHADGDPAWSPDGTKVVFARQNGQLEDIYSVSADGTGLTLLTTQGTDPAWSPDGSKIAFARMGPCSPVNNCSVEDTMNIYLMNPDGTGQVAVTTRPVAGEFNPQWSPDGRRILFEFNADEDPDALVFNYDIAAINPDGSNWVNVTELFGIDERAPQWSPDGQKIVFTRARYQVVLADPDGTNQTAVGVAELWNPDWQPLPSARYPYPASASTLAVSLVPALRQCGTGGNPVNSDHSGPLSVGSCNPPRPGSVVAFAGAASIGSASFTVAPGDRDLTNGNQADVALAANLTDIQTSAGADYDPNASGPDLTEVTRIQLTDTANGTYGGVAATAASYDFEVPIDCSPTSDPSAGSTCSANTTINAALPGLVRENRKTIVQAFRVRVDDSGTNGVPGDSDDRIFAMQGVFVP